MHHVGGRAAVAALLAAFPVAPLASQSALDRAPSRFAAYDGVRVHYKNLGTGPTAVVFIHGWSCDLTFWRQQAPALDGRARAIYVDLPGHGRSDKPERRYTMDFFAGAVDAVMQAAGVERAVLVGHSMGTTVMRQFYRRQGAKTIALVTVDGALRSFFTDTAQTRAFVARFEGPGFQQAMDQFLTTMFKPNADSALVAGVRRAVGATPQHVALSAMRESFDPAVWTEDPIEVPLLAIMAESEYWSPDYEAFVRRLAPRSQYQKIPGVGHFLMLERPEAVNPLLTSFLRRQGVLR